MGSCFTSSIASQSEIVTVVTRTNERKLDLAKSSSLNTVEEKEMGIAAPTPAYEAGMTDGTAMRVSSIEGDEPTEEEIHTLRHVSDSLPWSAFLVAAVELCERFAWYGLTGPFQNYIQVRS